ncbi:MAG: DUF1080 domain-containing protein [Pirellulales bacterium]|nr:DUF1080 domain-containing protein [Pirellulales bacterium]
MERRKYTAFLTTFWTATVLGGLGLSLAAAQNIIEYHSGLEWPEPKVVDPGPPGGPPSDALVLFDGKDLSEWEGGPWIVRDGSMTAHGDGLRTKRAFGDCQLHLEWAAPEKIQSSGQGRGNSGVYLMGLYEVQILDSYRNPTYFDGQAGAIYKQTPPMVNACRQPGAWQTYDIVFTAPRFDKEGKLLRPAYLTVLHNGVLIQNHFKIQGATAWEKAPQYAAHPPKLPLSLQYHGDPVKFRNIWIRELKEMKPVNKKNR